MCKKEHKLFLQLFLDETIVALSIVIRRPESEFVLKVNNYRKKGWQGMRFFLPSVFEWESRL